MKVLLVGNGGREHALAWKLSQSDLVDQIYVAPGNGGTGSVPKTENVAIGSGHKDFSALVQFAVAHNVDLVIPGPEQPLVEGIEGWFRKVGISVFGPSERAAVLEGSKAYSKNFMARHQIPTAAFANFSDFAKAKKYVEQVNHNVVIKASGLAAGKGVLIPSNKEEAISALKQVMVDKEFGEAGDEVVIEELLEGDEISILAFSDGYTVVDLPPAQDHKRIGNGDSGLNTGGMGAYAPAPVASAELLRQIRQTVLEPTIKGMRQDGTPFVGMLFTGFMLTKTGPKVLEYNVRFGDPETQTLLPLIKSDLAEIIMACVDRRLDCVNMELNPGFGATVVMSAAGYPEAYKKGDEITVDKDSQALVFHAGTAVQNGKLVTAGGRVIAATAVADTLESAVKSAYSGVDAIHFTGKYNRTDIAHRAFRQAVGNDKISITYEQAGVSVARGNELVQRIKASVKSTKRVGADAEIGGFGGLFDLKAAGFVDPLLVGATDGIGTKLKIAQAMKIHNTVGIDLVAMNVNDLVVQGAEPLMFLDYYASGHLDIEACAQFVEGVAQGCRESHCALIGGETAEMPSLYSGDDYDASGAAIGAVERDAILPKPLQVGDVILGLSSSGVHSNGFSLVRKILEVNGLDYTDQAPWDPSMTVGHSLLTPTRLYVKSLMPVIKRGYVQALAHITGGGLVENVPRVLEKGIQAQIDGSTWPVPPVFSWLLKAGNVPVDDAVKTLNMGIGMVLIVRPADLSAVTALLEGQGERVWQIGRTVAGHNTCVVSNMDWY